MSKLRTDANGNYDLDQVKREIDKWRDNPNAPDRIKLVTWLYDALMEAVDANIAMEAEINGLHRLFERIQRYVELDPSELMWDMACRETLHKAHRKALLNAERASADRYKKTAQALADASMCGSPID